MASEKKYTDEEYVDFTQIAYMNCIEEYANENKIDKDNAPTFKEIICESLGVDADSVQSVDQLRELVANAPTKDSEGNEEENGLNQGDKDRIIGLADEVFDYKIVDVYDNNDIAGNQSGSYGCVIETDDNQAVVAFRGCELTGSTPEKISDVFQDWIGGGLNLLNGADTAQQESAEQYADYLIENDVLDKYDSVDVTGHSLGGNLASHFGVISAEEGREELFDKIDNVVCLDSPGFSDDYLERHSEEIDKAKDKISGYSWSAIGNVLTQVAPENFKEAETLSLSEEENLENKITDWYASNEAYYEMIGVHDTRSLKYGSDGNLIESDGKVKSTAEALGEATSQMVSDVSNGLANTNMNVVSACKNIGYVSGLVLGDALNEDLTAEQKEQVETAKSSIAENSNEDVVNSISAFSAINNPKIAQAYLSYLKGENIIDESMKTQISSIDRYVESTGNNSTWLSKLLEFGKLHTADQQEMDGKDIMKALADLTIQREKRKRGFNIRRRKRWIG